MNPAAMAKFIDKLPQAFHEGDKSAPAKSAEAENVRLLQKQYSAVAEYDFKTALTFFDKDVELEIHCPPEIPFSGHWKGLDQVAKAMAANFGMVADQHPHIEQLVAQGDTVVLFARETGRYLPTGQMYDVHFVQLFQFRGGKVVRIRQVSGTTGLRAAVETA